MLQPSTCLASCAANLSSLLSPLSAAATAAAHATQQQLPGSVRLLQVLSGTLLQHVRSVAQPARQEMAEPHVADTAEQLPPTTASPPRQLSVRLADAAGDSQQHRHQQLVAPSVTTAASMMPQQQPQQHQPPSPTGVKKTFYKRKLPCPPATEFSSAEGRLLFAQALQQGTMSGFFKLIEQYSTQDEPAFCGLASIAMVLNALSIDPKRPWKGSWRWFHEELLDCCLPLSKVAQEGVVLTQAACLAKCNGANVTLHRSGTFSLDEFRQAVIDTCSSGEEHLVVSYTRKAFGQTGDGHFSPIGGYHGARDLVLILDTARFKYPPHWVPLPMLYEAMDAVDPTTGQPRGFLRLCANARPDSVLFTLDVRPDSSWRQAEAFIQTTAPQLVQAAAASGQATPEDLLQQLVALAPLDSVPSFIAMRFAAQSCARDRCVPHTVRQQVLRELRATPLHQAIQPLLTQHLAAQQQQQQPSLQDASQPQQSQQQNQTAEHSFLSEKLTVLLLLQEPSAWGDAGVWADQQQHEAWKHLLDASAVSILDGEVGYLRQQLHHIEDVLSVAGAESSSGGGGGDGGCGSCLGHNSNSSDAPAAAGGGCSSGPTLAGGVSQSVVAATQATHAVLQPEAAAEGGVSGSSPCSSCTFQHDCSLKGCLNVHGEVVVGGGGAAVGLDCGSSGGCCGGHHGDGERHQQHQQGEPVMQHHGCCS